MKIYESNQYIEKSKDTEWYQLSQVGIWDWNIKSICYRKDEDYTFYYCLKKCIAFSSNAYESKIVETLTDEMKEELLNMGYSLK